MFYINNIFKCNFLKKNIIKFFVIIETFLWLFKLFFFKGGYAVGVGGPTFLIVEYDTIAFFLRLTIIGVLFFINIRVKYYLVVPVVIFSFVVSHYMVMLKLYYFAKPFYIN